MKRFWEKVSVEARGDRFAVLLDGRGVKTPKRAELTLANAAIAGAVAAEWEACGEEIDPAAMPITGFANAALDRVAVERQSFIDAVAAFGETDLFCYRAEAPQELADRQEAIWGAHIGWAQRAYGISFEIIHGIVHKAQPTDTIAALKTATTQLSDGQLAAASKLTHLSGSLIAVLALAEAHTTADELWPDLILDELWQEEQWGADEFALKNRRDRKAEFAEAARFMAMCV